MFSYPMLRPELILCVVSAIGSTRQQNRTFYPASSKTKQKKILHSNAIRNFEWRRKTGRLRYNTLPPHSPTLCYQSYSRIS